MNEVFKAANDENDGAAGLVPAPTAGQQNLFLRGDATWADPVAGVMETIGEIQTQIQTMVGEDLNMSMRAIAQAEASAAVATIVAQAPDQFDTLKEIADWIQANQGAVDVAGLTTRVGTLEDAIFGVEADEENGIEAVIGLQAVVSNLQIQLNGVEETVATHTSDITEIKEAIKWQDIIDVTE